jgi:hypothetical protein
MHRTITLGIALALAGNLSAQEYNVAAPTAAEQRQEVSKKDLSPDERASREAEQMTRKLALNAEQKEQWRSAALERLHANAPVKEKMRGSTTPEERHALRARMRENNEAFDKKVQEFLTAEQKTKLEAQRTERREHKKDRRRGGARRAE